MENQQEKDTSVGVSWQNNTAWIVLLVLFIAANKEKFGNVIWYDKKKGELVVDNRGKSNEKCFELMASIGQAIQETFNFKRSLEFKRLVAQLQKDGWVKTTEDGYIVFRHVLGWGKGENVDWNNRPSQGDVAEVSICVVITLRNGHGTRMCAFAFLTKQLHLLDIHVFIISVFPKAVQAWKLSRTGGISASSGAFASTAVDTPMRNAGSAGQFLASPYVPSPRAVTGALSPANCAPPVTNGGEFWSPPADQYLPPLTGIEGGAAPWPATYAKGTSIASPIAHPIQNFNGNFHVGMSQQQQQQQQELLLPPPAIQAQQAHQDQQLHPDVMLRMLHQLQEHAAKQQKQTQQLERKLQAQLCKLKQVTQLLLQMHPNQQYQHQDEHFDWFTP